MAKTKNAGMIRDHLLGDDPELREMVRTETLHAQVARMIYNVRTQTRLTQQALAELIGTKQPSSLAWKMRTMPDILYRCFSESL